MAATFQTKWCVNTETTIAYVVQHMSDSRRLHCRHQVLQTHVLFGCLDGTHIIGDAVAHISRKVSTVYRNTSLQQRGLNATSSNNVYHT